MTKNLVCNYQNRISTLPTTGAWDQSTNEDKTYFDSVALNLQIKIMSADFLSQICWYCYVCCCFRQWCWCDDFFCSFSLHRLVSVSLFIRGSIKQKKRSNNKNSADCWHGSGFFFFCSLRLRDALNIILHVQASEFKSLR